MGDISAEPSMEDILSSIKRIIAEESDPVAGRPRRPAARPVAATSEPRPFDREEVLELNEPAPEPLHMPEPLHVPEPTRVPEAREPLAQPAPLAAPLSAAPVPADAILSQRTAEASRGPLDALSRLVVKPEAAGSDTLEGMVREMLRPMLKDWLDAHLPTMVEAMVAREIERITGK